MTVGDSSGRVPVLFQFTEERFVVDVERFGRVGLAAASGVEDALDVEPFDRFQGQVRLKRGWEGMGSGEGMGSLLDFAFRRTIFRALRSILLRRQQPQRLE